MTNSELFLPSRSEDYVCQCGEPAKVRMARKSGGNQGRIFANCSRPIDSQCRFFRWLSPPVSQSRAAGPIYVSRDIPNRHSRLADEDNDCSLERNSEQSNLHVREQMIQPTRSVLSSMQSPETERRNEVVETKSDELEAVESLAADLKKALGNIWNREWEERETYVVIYTAVPGTLLFRRGSQWTLIK